MGHRSPSAGRRCAASAAGCPRCSSAGRRAMRRLRPAFRQRPRASSARPVLRSLRPTAGPSAPVRRSAWQGGHCPEPPRCLAPRQSGSSPGCCQVVRERIGRFAETVCRPGYAPTAAESATWRTVPCAVHLPARRDTIAPWHVGRGVPRPGRARPGRRPGCPEARPAARTTGCPVDGRSAAVYAELLRRAQNMPWTSGWPRRGRLGRHPSAVHCTRIISASPAQSS